MPFSHRDYTVACICPMGVELAPVKAMLDKPHPRLVTQRDQNSYTLGQIAGHNMVIAVLPEIGTNAAAAVATQLLNDFPSIRFGLLVGIGGGIPDEEEDGYDIRLGDVVVSKPTASFGGVVQFDIGKYSTSGGFDRTGVLGKPPRILQASVETLAAEQRMTGSRVPHYLSQMLHNYPAMEEYSYPGAQQDQLFQADYPHSGGRNCSHCDRQRIVERDDRPNSNPKFHYGIIGSANTVVKDTGLREELRRALKIICVEMEAAGLMGSFPCLVIRGICDYADSHKNKKWQPYAAATAAAYMKELLSIIPPKDVAKVPTATDVVQIPKYDKGLNFFDAPDISDNLFIGRVTELEQIKHILLPDSNPATTKVLVLGGTGGIGKTQLAIIYAKQYGSCYSSVFWLNATSEVTLNNSLRRVANRVFSPETVGKLDDDEVCSRVSSWLSELDNDSWMLVLDNYDDPDQFDITKYYPSVTHGSIIITTRQPRRVRGEQIKVVPMTEVNDSLAILAARSGRQGVLLNPEAHRLAQRLGGFPLALATAGAFLKESSVSFADYLQQYEAKWKVVLDDEGLPDYPTRTLYTTWDLSLSQIRKRNPQAIKLLAFLAYFDHQDIWYELFHGAQPIKQPRWFSELLGDKFCFEGAMRTLTRYCLVETHYLTESYSLHVCVHDWTLNGLNHVDDTHQYWLAFDCVASHIRVEDWDTLSTLRYRRLTPHALRLAHRCFQGAGSQQDWLRNRHAKVEILGELLHQQVQYKAAERMYMRAALAGKEKALGPEHPSTLSAVHNLGSLYGDQGKLDEAEQMFMQALAGKEKALGSDHLSTLSTVNNLGILYRDQGKLDEAEQMYIRALAGKEKALGPDHPSTLDTVNNLGILYSDQGKLDEAEQMYMRALAGSEKALGPEHPSTLDTVHNLGILYRDQGKLDEAEQVYMRALAGYEKALGLEHPSTLKTVNNLGNLYRDQGKLNKAEQMFTRARTRRIR